MKSVSYFALCFLMLISLLMSPMGVFGGEDNLPVIDSQPASLSLALGGLNQAMRVEAHSPNGGTLVYQWYMASDEEGNDLMKLERETQSSLYPKIILGTSYYRVEIRNQSKNGNMSQPVYSRWAEVSIYECMDTYRLSVSQMPTKTTYTLGEVIDLTGLIVSIQGPDGVLLSEDGSFLLYYEDPLTQLGQVLFEIGYENAKTSFTITVEEEEIQILGLRLALEPTKKKYRMGEKILLDGMELYLVTNRGEELLDNYDDLQVNPSVCSRLGKETITLSYGQESLSFNITIEDVPATSEMSMTSTGTSEPSTTKPETTGIITSEPLTRPEESTLAPNETTNTTSDDTGNMDPKMIALGIAGGLFVLIIVISIASAKSQSKKKSEKATQRKVITTPRNNRSAANKRTNHKTKKYTPSSAKTKTNKVPVKENGRKKNG